MTASKNPGCLAGLLNLFFPPPTPARRSAPAPVPVVPAAPVVSEPEIYPYRLRDDFLSPAEASFYRVVCPESHRLLTGESPVLVRVRPPGSRQPM